MNGNILRRRVREEKKAQRDYGQDAAQFRAHGDKPTARLLGHIRSEERQHARELKKRMRSVPLSSVRRVR